MPIRWGRLTQAEQERVMTCPLPDLFTVTQGLDTSYAGALVRRGKRAQLAKPAPTPILNKWESLQGDAVIISDPQVPYHDADFINAVWRVGSAWGIATLIWAGDFYNFDDLGPFMPEVVTPSPQEERDAGVEIFSQAGERFPNQLWAMGNHDARHVKALMALGYNFETSIGMLAPACVQCSPYHYCDLLSGGKRWRIEHPKNASVTPGAVGVDLAAKFLCNVIVAHGHTIGVRRDRSGHYTIIDSGGAFHLDKLPYVSLEHSKRPAMNQGAVIVRGGHGWLLDPLNTDMEALEWLGPRMAK